MGIGPRRQKTSECQPSSRILFLLSAPGFIVISLLFVFQNCADPLQVANEDSVDFFSTLPLAYDAKVDHIAYMSCSNMETEANLRGYFTFRAGAHGNEAGLRFSDDYLAATQNLLPQSRLSALADSEVNQGTNLQMALRYKKDYASVITNQGGSPQQGQDYHNFLLSLDTEEIGQTLVTLEEGERANFFDQLPGLDERRLEGSLRFLKSEEGARFIRERMDFGVSSEAGLLTINYAKADENSPLVALGPDPATLRTKIYGNGYQFTFGTGQGLPGSGGVKPYSTGDRRVIKSVTELDLLDGRTTGANWTCPDVLRFVIVRPEEFAYNPDFTQCRMMADPALGTLSSGDQLVLKSVRNVLPVEDWYVDLDNRCVVSKNIGFSCYGNQYADQINYFGGACTDEAPNLCPHFVSICVRVP